MAGPILADRAKEITASTGVGDISLGGTTIGYRAVSTVMDDGDWSYFGCVHQSADEWEIFRGTYIAGTNSVSRGTVLSSSSGGAAVDFSDGTKDVWIDAPASYLAGLTSQEAVSPNVSYATATAVAAGGQATINSDQLQSGTVGRLLGVDVWSSVPIKIALYAVSNGVAVGPKGGGVGALGEWAWRTPARAAVSVTENAGVGLDGFRVVVTNLDVSLAADVYAAFYYDEE